MLAKQKRSSARSSKPAAPPKPTRPKTTRVCPFCRMLVSAAKRYKHWDWYVKHLAGCSRRPKGVSQAPNWVRLTCEGCETCDVLIHTTWQNPLILCKPCRETRREAIRVEREVRREADRVLSEKRRESDRAKCETAKALRPRMPTSGWRVSGGLPSLGKR